MRGAEGEEGGEEGEARRRAAPGQGGAQGQRRSWQSGGGGEGMTPEELAEMLFKSLLSADAGLMNMVARNAVDRYAGMEPGRPVAAPTTCTARCGTWIWMRCWSA